ncbi:MAG: hypothetical protein HRU47_07570, partial [Verrucomicrobiales bacterium]|nr:hypothetical protein [Verrucomicrobiales bacterium]
KFHTSEEKQYKFATKRIAEALEANKDAKFQYFNRMRVIYNLKSKKAVAKHVEEVKIFIRNITEASKRGEDSSSFSLKAPSFPEAGKSETVSSDTIPTYAYNWCVSPLTPMGVSGVIWVPSESKIGEDPSQYAAELEIYAKSLPNTYAKESVQFLYAQPANSLVKDITVPMIPGAKSTSFDQWPKSLKNIAIELAELAE